MTEEPINPYYLALSERFNTLSIILLMIIPVFLFTAVFLNRKMITADNLYYLFKDINAASELAGADGNEFQYPRSDSMDFAVYKKGLAVIGEKELCLYTATGRQTLNTTTEYSTPVIRSSGKYVLTYDLGGKNVSLYNSFARIFRKTYEYPVNYAAISDAGVFLTVTSDATYTSVVEVYSSGFSLINTVSKNGYVVSAALSESAVHGALATVQAVGGAFSTEIMTFVPGSAQENVKTWTLDDTLPLYLAYLAEERLLVICDNACYIFNNNGQEFLSFEYGERSIAQFAVSGSDFALLLEDKKANFEIIAMEKGGGTRYKEKTTEKISDIGLCDGYLFLQKSEGVERITLLTGKKSLTECQTEEKRLLIVSKEEILLCSSIQGTYVKIKE